MIMIITIIMMMIVDDCHYILELLPRLQPGYLFADFGKLPECSAASLMVVLGFHWQWGCGVKRLALLQGRRVEAEGPGVCIYIYICIYTHTHTHTYIRVCNIKLGVTKTPFTHKYSRTVHKTPT